MYFNVWENPDGSLAIEDVEKSTRTLEYAKSLYKRKLIDFFGGSITTPVPGSGLWQIASRHNLIKPECVGNWDMWFYKRDLRLVSIFPGVSEAEIFKLHQKTIKYTALGLIKARVLDFRNLPFTLRRGSYFLKREVLRLGKVVLDSLSCGLSC